MRTVIDLVLLAIIIISIWSGYKKGFIMGIAGVVAIVVSLYAASLVSSAFSYEVVPALRPFASGYVESQMQDTVLEDMGLADTELSYEDILSNDPELRHDFCATCYKTFGIYDDAAEQMATEAETYADEHNSTIEEAIVEVLCTRVAYIAGVVLLFIIFLITLMTLANIPNLSFRIPNMDILNDAGRRGHGTFDRHALLHAALVDTALRRAGHRAGYLRGHAAGEILPLHRLPHRGPRHLRTRIYEQNVNSAPPVLTIGSHGDKLALEEKEC